MKLCLRKFRISHLLHWYTPREGLGTAKLFVGMALNYVTVNNKSEATCNNTKQLLQALPFRFCLIDNFPDAWRDQGTWCTCVYHNHVYELARTQPKLWPRKTKATKMSDWLHNFLCMLDCTCHKGLTVSCLHEALSMSMHVWITWTHITLYWTCDRHRIRQRYWCWLPSY